MDSAKTGKSIKEMLLEEGMTQQELADKLFISKAAVSKNLKGNSSFDIDNLQKIAKFFHITIDELVEGERAETIQKSRQKSSKPKLERTSSYSDALINAKTYITDINQDRYTYNDMSMSKYWYYFKELDTFAANKFLAYKDNNNEKYYHYTKVIDVMDGGHARKHLEKFFKTSNDEQIYTKFREFQSIYKIKNSKKIQQAILFVKK